MFSRNTLRACIVMGLFTLGCSMAQAADNRYPPMPGNAAGNMPPPPPINANSAMRAQPAPVPRRSYGGPAMPYRGAPYPAGRPYPPAGPYRGGVPYGPRGPYGAGPYPGGPYGGGYNRGPWGGNRGPFGGGRDPFDSFFGGGRYGDGPFGDFFGRRGFGGRDGILGMHPEDWFTGGEDGLEQMWDEMINAPSEMGEMPGGWSAPEVSIPNPVDVQRQFRDEAPEFVREVPDMININP